MTKTLARRDEFATNYYNGIYAHKRQFLNTTPPFAYNANLYYEVDQAYRNAYERFTRYPDGADPKMDTKRADEYRKAMKKMREHFEKLEEVLENGMPARAVVPNFSKELVLEEIDALHGEFEEVKISEDSKKLCVLTEDIVLKTKDEKDEFNFGRFWLYVQPTYSSYQTLVESVSKHKPKYGADRGNYHPHLFGTRLCQGQGEGPAIKIAADGRLYDLLMLNRQVLRNVKYDSGHLWPDHWIYEKCPNCAGMVKDIKKCKNCGTGFCPGCTRKCNQPGCDGKVVEDHCVNCVKQCAQCKKNTCKKHGFVCAYCFKMVCDTCAPDRECKHEDNITVEGKCSKRRL